MRTSGIMKLTPAVSGLPSTRVSSLMSGDTSGFMLSSFSCTDGAQVEIRLHRWHHTIRIAPGKTHSFVAGYAAWGMLHSVTAKPTSESGTIDWCATDID